MKQQAVEAIFQAFDLLSENFVVHGEPLFSQSIDVAALSNVQGGCGKKKCCCPPQVVQQQTIIAAPAPAPAPMPSSNVSTSVSVSYQ